DRRSGSCKTLREAGVRKPAMDGDLGMIYLLRDKRGTASARFGPPPIAPVRIRAIRYMCRCVVLGLPVLVFLLTTRGSVGAVSRPRQEPAPARQGAGMTHTTAAARQVGSDVSCVWTLCGVRKKDYDERRQEGCGPIRWARRALG